ncbi:hypothetical protein [Sinorhizobium fredii]|uniref:hypothetical protein n=1 Tax=Rhizobium fredii TaxID=380 RepID=UPI0002E040CE|nr:hypothetical protein [Sinorhizobium fredii]
MTKRKSPEDLGNFRWSGTQDLRFFGRRSRLYPMGHDRPDIDARPVIALINML